MNIRWKVTTVVAGLFVALSVTAILVARYVLMPSFTTLEHTEADVAMRRIQFALDRMSSQLALSAASWGNWTDAWRFAQDHNHTFIDEQVTAAGLKQLKINLLLFTDPSGRFIASSTLDLQTDKPVNLGLASRENLPLNFPWRGSLQEGRPAQGFVRTELGVMQLAAAPVLDGFGHVALLCTYIYVQKYGTKKEKPLTFTSMSYTRAVIRTFVLSEKMLG